MTRRNGCSQAARTGSEPTLLRYVTLGRNENVLRTDSGRSIPLTPDLGITAFQLEPDRLCVGEPRDLLDRQGAGHVGEPQAGLNAHLGERGLIAHTAVR